MGRLLGMIAPGRPFQEVLAGLQSVCKMMEKWGAARVQDALLASEVHVHVWRRVEAPGFVVMEEELQIVQQACQCLIFMWVPCPCCGRLWLCVCGW